MTVKLLLNIAAFAWPVSEVVLGIVRRARRNTSVVKDRGSIALLWSVIVLSFFAAFALRHTPAARMPMSPALLSAVALVLLVAGLAIRWIAIITLGRFFTTTVAISADQRIIRRGPYAVVRHPSYTGLCLAFLGLGFAFGSWLSLVVLVAPITLAILYRIRIEETALKEAFGEEYRAYSRETARLVPWIF